jgi:hypothetical protein
MKVAMWRQLHHSLNIVHAFQKLHVKSQLFSENGIRNSTTDDKGVEYARWQTGRCWTKKETHSFKT